MTKHEDDEIVIVGDAIPRLASVEALDSFEVAVTWEAGSRSGRRDVVDLAPAIVRYRVYAPLLDERAMLRSVRLQEHRFGIAWGEGDAIGMGAATVEDLAEEVLSAEDVAGFMVRHHLTLDGAAAELGIGRRMAAYYRKQHRIPRTVALACRYIDAKLMADATRS